MDEDHTASFITALANLQPHGLGEVGAPAAAAAGVSSASPDQLAILDGWSPDQLRIEVVRLRRALALRGAPDEVIDPQQVQVHQHQQQHQHQQHQQRQQQPPVPSRQIQDALLQSHLASFAQPPPQFVHTHQQPPHQHPGPPPPPHPHLSPGHPHGPHQHPGGGPGPLPQHPQATVVPFPTNHKRRLDDIDVSGPPGPVPGPSPLQQHQHQQPLQQQQQQLQGQHQPGPTGSPPHSRRNSVRKPTMRDVGTGKRVEKGRRIELQRAIRTKMRLAMNIGPDDQLPPPSALTAPEMQPEGAAYWVPNWPAGVSDGQNSQWIDRVCQTFIAEARAFQGWSKVPLEDLEDEVVKGAARTAFQNFAKRYMAEVDPLHAKKKEKYVKNRRRWARKDLKQKRRAKAAHDPSFAADIHLPPAALHIDYMSSEYSSAGEDEGDESVVIGLPALRDQRRAHWLDVLGSQPHEAAKPGKGGWAEGVTEKVLEVRTPTWRSAQLDETYRRLDTISAAQAALRATPASQQATAAQSNKPAGSLRLGHVAPSHKRFTMPPPIMRRGHLPRDTGDAWMWASGSVGVWPDSLDQIVDGMDASAAMGGMDMDAVANGGASGLRGVVDGMDVGVVDDEGMMDPTSVDALVEGWTEVA